MHPHAGEHLADLVMEFPRYALAFIFLYLDQTPGKASQLPFRLLHRFPVPVGPAFQTEKTIQAQKSDQYSKRQGYIEHSGQEALKLALAQGEPLLFAQQIRRVQP